MTAEWTMERLGRMTVNEIKQLRDNAVRLDQSAVADLCSEALKARPRAPIQARAQSALRTRARHLVSRGKAFEGRGVYLENPRGDWSGVRRADGMVVFALWADAVESSDGTCRHLLWAPNVDGARPWSEKPAGRARLEHCKRALESGRAEGLLVYGEALQGYAPEDKAHTIYGVDAELVLVLAVQQRGNEYCAVWGKRATSSSMLGG